MQFKTGLIIFIFYFSLSGFRFSLAQQPAFCIAVITEINGEAFLKKVNKSEFSKTYWGTQLFEGDEIKTSNKSEVKLLFSNSSFISLGPNSTIKISMKVSPATEPAGDIKNISTPLTINLFTYFLKREDKNDAGALAGLRSVTMDQPIVTISPCNTLIKTDRPSFSWITKKSFDNYVVNLYNSKGLVWSKKVPENTMRYPDNEKGLEFGESYSWNVEGEYPSNAGETDDHRFSVLSLERSKEVEENENTIRNTFKNDLKSSSLHYLLGTYYINNGLLLDAISEIQIIAKINTDAALPHEILGSLYLEVGDKDKAIDELQKALILAQNRDK